MYGRMYAHLFNAVTDALEELAQQNYGAARQLLVQAQQECEELYLDGEAEEDG